MTMPMVIVTMTTMTRRDADADADGDADDDDDDLLNVQQVRKQGGTVIKKEYTLHPRLFKLCLMT